jgi:hypothetical protein
VLCFFDPEDRGDMSSETSVDFQRTTWRYIPENKLFFFSFLLFFSFTEGQVVCNPSHRSGVEVTILPGNRWLQPLPLSKTLMCLAKWGSGVGCNPIASLAPCGRIRLGKLIVAQAVEKFPDFNGIPISCMDIPGTILGL